MDNRKEKGHTPIAIVAIGSLFAQSLDVANFWNNIVEGKDLITDVPSSHWLIDDFYDPDRKKTGKVYVRRGSFIPSIEFDPIEFGIPPKTIGPTDPSQLLSLIVAKKLLEETRSFQEEKVSTERTSVIIGAAGPTSLHSLETGLLAWPHWEKALRDQGLPEKQVIEIKEKIFNLFPVWNEDTFPGLLGNVIAGRIANRFNLKGTNCIVDAACAGSLAALKMSIMELATGEADLVISGGVDALNDIMMFSCFSKTGALSYSEDCRPFSSAADGTLLGEGISLFALRRLEDAERDGDHIYAVIKGIGSSSDGKGMSIYAPLAQGQALAMERAYNNAGCSPEEVELVEAHGTGTVAGDIAEFQALMDVFSKNADSKRQRCALGSIKSQIGHCKGAAGAAGLFKVVMALNQKVLPPVIKVDEPNPKLNIESSPFYLNTQTRPWIHPRNTSRKAAVSSFGFGGTNFHVILEEYRGRKSTPLYHFKANLFLFSAHDLTSLENLSQEVIDGFQAKGFSALARDTQKTFDPYLKHRLAIIASSEQEFKERLKMAIQHIQMTNEPKFTMPNEYHYSSEIGGESKIAFLFSGEGQYCGMGGALAMAFPASRRVWDAAAEIRFDPLLSLQDVVFPIPAFTEKEKLQQESRLNEAVWSQPGIGAVALSQLALLKKVDLNPDFVAGVGSGEITTLFANGGISTEKELLQILRKLGEAMAGESSSKAMKDMIASEEITKKIHSVLVDQADYHEKFQQEISALYAHGVRVFIEIGPGTLLTELMQNCLEGEEYTAISFDHRNQPGLITFWDALGAIAVAGFPMQLGHLWDDLVIPEEIRNAKPKSPATVKINGAVYGKPYPPKSPVAEAYPAVKTYQKKDEHLQNQKGPTVMNENKPKEISPAEQVQRPLEKYEQQAKKISPKITEEQPLYNQSDMGELLKALHELQTNALEAQKQFQEILTQNHQAYLKLIETALHEMGHLGVHPISETQTTFEKSPPSFSVEAKEKITRETEKKQAIERVAPISKSEAKTLAPPPIEVISASNARPAQKQPQKVSAPQQQPQPVVPKVPLASLRKPVSTSNVHYNNLLLDIVAENTGYPKEMLDLDMELEAGLGIDSIKRVEILSALQEKAPELANQDTSQMTQLRTLRAILDFLQGIDTTSAANSMQIGPEAKTIASPPVMEKDRLSTPPTASLMVDGIDFTSLLLDIVAENTGYPKEMLDLDMELEAGLGIDSIKRVEILSALQEKAPKLAEQDTSQMTQLRTLRAILDFIRDSSTGEGSSQKKK